MNNFNRSDRIRHFGNIFLLIALVLMAIALFSGCSERTITLESPTEDGVKMSYIADFYDNHGSRWLSIEGSSFDISPNKVKEYAYDSNGSWISSWTTSSIMSITIDGRDIETCGSTVIFADDQLKPYEMNLPEEVKLSDDFQISITVPDTLRGRDYWDLNWWWDTAQQSHTQMGQKIVIIQSQLGDPIRVYSGNAVTWEVSRNLPKTTEVNIDGHMVYIHRANFSIIDASVFQ